MPELPEVETIVKGLRSEIIGKTLKQIDSFRKDTVKSDFSSNWNDNKYDNHQLNPHHQTDYGTIREIIRRGKYIIIRTSLGLEIMVHLRMTGKLIYAKHSCCSGWESHKHVRASFGFSDGTVLLFHDVRTFGTIMVLKNKSHSTILSKLGAEPLDRNFNVNYLGKKFQKLKAPVKNSLLNQEIVAGLGNIYVNEILYRAGIIPTTPSNTLSKTELKKIILQTKAVLFEAIQKNGTSISDYRRVDDKTGEFQNFLRVYQKKVCLCGNKITKIRQAGRSTFYCDHCQK